MYKAMQMPGGWGVFWQEKPEDEPRQIAKAVQRPQDEASKWHPYTRRQAAYRRAKRLNDLLKQTDERIKRDGAIIL